MIGKPDWFDKKIFGFGIRPKTWQGWVYLLMAIVLIVFARYQPFWECSDQIKNIATIVLVAIILIDIIHIMYVLNKKNNSNG